MEKAENFTKQFIEKLSNDEYKKEMCPKPEFVMTDDFVEEEIDKYNRVLDSGVLDVVTIGETVGYLKQEKENRRRQEIQTMGDTLQILKQEKEVAGGVNKDCRTCQNMSCRVEHHEKPVEGCLGYINHDKTEGTSVRRTLAKSQNKSN